MPRKEMFSFRLPKEAISEMEEIADSLYKTKLLKDHPKVRKLGILPLQVCEDKDEVRCGYYDVCPITTPLWKVINVGGYAVTYQKLVALFLSTGEIAGRILSTILSTDHLIFNEAHTIRYPDTISVQVHPEIDLSKFYDLNYPVLPSVVSGFTDILTNVSDAIEQIKTDAPQYTSKHLAYQITMAHPVLKESKHVAIGISSLIDLMIHRHDHDLSIDDVVLLKDMLLLCAERKHVVHGIISTKADGGKQHDPAMG